MVSTAMEYFGHRFWCPMSTKHVSKATAGDAIGGATPAHSKLTAARRRRQQRHQRRLRRSTERRAALRRAPHPPTKRFIVPDSPVVALGCIPEDVAVVARAPRQAPTKMRAAVPAATRKTRPTTRLITGRTSW